MRMACFILMILVACLFQETARSQNKAPQVPNEEMCEGISHSHDEDDLRVMTIKVEGVERCSVSYSRPGRAEAGVLYLARPGFYVTLGAAGPEERGAETLKRGDLGSAMYCGYCRALAILKTR